MTIIEKRRVADQFLSDPQWAEWSDRAIAETCGVSHTFVGKRRRLLEEQAERATWPAGATPCSHCHGKKTVTAAKNQEYLEMIEASRIMDALREGGVQAEAILNRQKGN